MGIHYKFNTRLDTPFWQACRADTELGPVQELVDFYQENGPSTFARTNLIHGNDLFGMEGYLSLLVGQRVPYRARHTPTSEELAFWNGLQAENRRAAQTAFSVREALDGVLKADCRWKPGFFKDRSLMQLTNYIGSAS